MFIRALFRSFHWRCRTALFARPDKPLQLDFADGRLSASNQLNGSYASEAGKLQVDAMMHTMMACPDPALTALDMVVESETVKP